MGRVIAVTAGVPAGEKAVWIEQRAFAAADEQAAAGRLRAGLDAAQQRPLARVAAEDHAGRPELAQAAEHGLVGAARAAADAAA